LSHDILLAPPDAGHTLSDAALRAFVRDLASRRLFVPVAEAVASTWVALEFEPGVDAHQLFDEGAAPPEAAFLRAQLRVGERPAEHPFGGGPAARFSFVIYGAHRDRLHGAVLQRLRESLNLRLEASTRPAEPCPPLPEVPADEAPPPTPKRAEPKAGRIGTHIEEF
jgi:hypothetical protein